MKNVRMEAQINEAQLTVETLVKSLEIAALSDDGVISKEEQKTIRKLQKLSAKYLAGLRKIRETS